MRDAWVLGKIASVEEGLAATFDLRSRDVPSVMLMVGPSGSGKSTLVPTIAAGHAVVSLDELRASRGDRGDQSANDAVLRAALGQLEALLADGRDAVWDATSLVPMQRKLVLDRAQGRHALTTAVVLAPSREEAHARNARRAHAVPPRILDEQLDRFWPPYPSEAHRIFYVGASGAVEDTAGDPFTDDREDVAS
jgi:predicted kinase